MTKLTDMIEKELADWETNGLWKANLRRQKQELSESLERVARSVLEESKLRDKLDEPEDTDYELGLIDGWRLGKNEQEDKIKLILE